MSFLLDTNVLSEHLRRPSGLAHRFAQHSGQLYTSSISLSELYDWVFGRANPEPRRSAVETLITYEVSVVPFDSDCAEESGRLNLRLDDWLVT